MLRSSCSADTLAALLARFASEATRRLIHAMTCPTLPPGRATDTASAIFFTASLSFPARGAEFSSAQTVSLPRTSHHLSSAADSAAVVKLPAQPLILASVAQLKSRCSSFATASRSPLCFAMHAAIRGFMS